MGRGRGRGGGGGSMCEMGERVLGKTKKGKNTCMNTIERRCECEGEGEGRYYVD